MTDSDILDHSS